MIKILYCATYCSTLLAAGSIKQILYQRVIEKLILNCYHLIPSNSYKGLFIWTSSLLHCHMMTLYHRHALSYSVQPFFSKLKCNQYSSMKVQNIWCFKGYNPLVMVRPLLFQILNEAWDFPVKLHHHPGLEKTPKDILDDLQAAVVTWSRTALGCF